MYITYLQEDFRNQFCKYQGGVDIIIEADYCDSADKKMEEIVGTVDFMCFFYNADEQDSFSSLKQALEVFKVEGRILKPILVVDKTGDTKIIEPTIPKTWFNTFQNSFTFQNNFSYQTQYE